MAKKKSHKKKSQYKSRKRSSATVPGTATITQPEQVAGQPQLARLTTDKPGATKSGKAADKDSSEVVIARRARYEVGHALLLAGIIMLGLIALWLVMSYTSLGAQVYKLIQI